MSFNPEQVIRQQADTLAECALAVVRREFPHRLDHLILHERDQPLPREIHPIFHGSYDWHSSVHMHWSMLRLRVMAPQLALRSAIEGHVDQHFTRAMVEREREYASAPGRGGFERPYGWAWLLKLQAELHAQASSGDEPARRWADAMVPFACDIALRLAGFLGRSHYAVRTGMHANSAFAMLLARDYAQSLQDAALLNVIDSTARRWFGDDRAYPSGYEPGGADFLSAGLCEALLMQRVLGDSFAPWWKRFDTSGEALRHWLAPAVVSDRTDAQLVHLDGLNLSRAWCLGELASAVPPEQSQAMTAAALAHWNAAWPHVTVGDFAATHWLVSFALLSADREQPTG